MMYKVTVNIIFFVFDYLFNTKAIIIYIYIFPTKQRLIESEN
jgi:hypothetical protein